jgi:hypothetical protein
MTFTKHMMKSLDLSDKGRTYRDDLKLYNKSTAKALSKVIMTSISKIGRQKTSELLRMVS